MTKEDLEERFGGKWEIHPFLMIGVAASRRRQRLTWEEEANGMVLVLIAADLEELADKMAAQPDSRTPDRPNHRRGSDSASRMTGHPRPVITKHKPVTSRALVPPVAGHAPPWSCR